MEDLKCVSYCRMSLFLAHRALNELKTIIFIKDSKKNSAANSETIKFYSVTLHYMLVLELTKLLEDKVKGEHKKGNHFASLYRLNNEVNDQHNPPVMNSDHQIIESRLNKIRGTTFFQSLKIFRDKKLAHTDSNYEQEALEIIGFSNKDILDATKLIRDLQDILNDCLSHTDRSFHLIKTKKTENFLNFYDDYEGFAFSRFRDFSEWKQNEKH